MKVEIWSDVVCPWCYIGKRRFEAALATFPHSDEVTVSWRSFELSPDMPADFAGSSTEHLMEKTGYSADQIASMQQRVTDAAAAEGLEFRLDQTRTGPTVDAHQLIHLAAAHGLGEQMKERLLRGFFTEGEPIADRATLVRLAAEVGLDADEAGAVLDSGAYLEAVRADQAQARSYGITSVPFFVVDQKFGVSGAQATSIFADLLEHAWTDAHPLTMVAAGLGSAGDDADPSCEDGSCAV